jgi:hypothetical protein
LRNASYWNTRPRERKKNGGCPHSPLITTQYVEYDTISIMNNSNDSRSPTIKIIGSILWAAVIIVPVAIFLTQGVDYFVFTLFWVIIVLVVIAKAFSYFTRVK